MGKEKGLGNNSIILHMFAKWDDLPLRLAGILY